MDRLEIDNILKIDELNSELEFEKATSIHGKLRWMAKDDSSLESVRQHLMFLIQKYEKNHWEDESKISDEQINESGITEKIVKAENLLSKNEKKK